MITLVVGPSGSGKDHLLKAFELTKVVSWTTRERRIGEVDGVDHRFTSAEHFELIKDSVLAYTFFHGNHYWVRQSDLEGKDAYVIDPAGINFFRLKVRTLADAGINIPTRVVYVTAPWYRRLKRMVGRECRTWYHWLRPSLWKKALSRIWHDHEAFKAIPTYDYRIDT